MRKSDILQRGSQIKAINMKVYIEDMYREKTDINVLFFCKQRRRNHHNEDASKARRVWIRVNELYRLIQHLQKVVQILSFIIYYMNKFSDLAEGVVMTCRWQSIICKVEWAVFWKWRFVKRCKCHPSLKYNQKRDIVIESSFCNIYNEDCSKHHVHGLTNNKEKYSPLNYSYRPRAFVSTKLIWTDWKAKH